MEKWRLFIAVEMPDDIRARFAALQDDMRKAAQFTRAEPSWTSPKSTHLTLQFLGNTDVSKVDELKAALGRAVDGVEAFEIRLRSVGGFPNMKRPRVLWLGVGRGAEQLGELQRRVVKETASLGFEPERRPYHPHLTLARIKTSRGIEALMDVLAHFKSAKCGEFTAGEVVLFRSQLNPGGAVYTALHREPLRSPSS